MNIKIILIVGLLVCVTPHGVNAGIVNYNDCPFNITNYVTAVDYEQFFKSITGTGYANVTIIVYGKTRSRYEYINNASNRLMTTKTYVSTTGMGYTLNYSTSDSVFFTTNMQEGTVMYAYSSAYVKHKYDGSWSFYSGKIKAYSTSGYSNVAVTTEIIEGSVLFITEEQNVYNVAGNTSCLDWIKLYQDDNLIAFKELNSTNFNYTFSLLNGTYKLNFSNDHEYEFIIGGANITYDYDGCIQTTYKLVELCENLIPDSEGYYCEYTNDIISCNYFEESTGILNISNSSATKIEIYTNTFIGQTKWIIDPVVNGTTYIVINPNIAWSLKVIVQNESDESLIDEAMVKVDQDCYCISGYTTRQKLTVCGLVSFSDMSLQDASLFVMAAGYKTIDISSTNYSLFLSGLSNFSSKAWIVKLVSLESENESTWYAPLNKVDIHFRNVDGNRTSKIVDTDSQVYLYYENNNTDGEDMTLKFQSSSTHTHFIDVESWNIPYDSIGHKIILNVNFTPYDYSYKAIIYNSSIYGWNITIPLTVRNNTKESEQHYENLSTNLWFMYASDGKIDYRNDMNIGVHACSNNTTLMSVDIELYKNNVLLCYKNLTWADFTNADPQFYYIWSPSFNYISGSNYSVRMYGFDRTLLETDYVDCYTDNMTRKNKLTIIVKNHYGTNLDNAFIYLEEYGSISTGINYYASFEGLDNGYYRFKATKPDYVGTGWSDITITDSDEIVTYVLTSTESEAGSAMQPQKMDESELQNIYLIIMAFLLIFIIIGGLKYAL